MNHRRFVRLSLISLAGASIAVGQAGSGAAKQSSSPAPAISPAKAAAPAASDSPAKSAPAQTESNISPETPVITLNGVCDVTLNGTAKTPPRTLASAKTGSATAHTAAPAGACKTEVTRAEFDGLMKLVAPTAPASARRQIATKYVQLLTAANEGMKLGVEKEPTFPLMLLQLIANAAESKLRSDASNVSDADAKNYYDQNQSAFEEVTLTRIFIPRTPPATATATQTTAGTQPAGGAPAVGAPAQPSTDADAIAKAARDQLAVGGDPEKIEKSAFDQLKNATPPPTTKFGAKRRGTLPPVHEQKVFALKAGEVSEVIPDTLGYMIYRVDSKQQLPFDQVKDQAKQRVTQLRLADAQQQIMTSASKADYNDAYFGPEAAAAAPPRVPPTQSAPPAATPVQSPNPPQYPVNTQTPTPVTNQPQHVQATTPKQ